MDEVPPQFREIWIESPRGRLLCALINSEVGGCLIYLRAPGDAGFSSRNPDYSGPRHETVKYKLANGQVDHYPRAWAYPVAVVERAVEHFRVTGFPPTFIAWNNDSGDGESIDAHEPRGPGKG